MTGGIGSWLDGDAGDADKAGSGMVPQVGGTGDANRAGTQAADRAAFGGQAMALGASSGRWEWDGSGERMETSQLGFRLGWATGLCIQL